MRQILGLLGLVVCCLLLLGPPAFSHDEQYSQTISAQIIEGNATANYADPESEVQPLDAQTARATINKQHLSITNEGQRSDRSPNLKEPTTQEDLAFGFRGRRSSGCRRGGCG